MHQNFRLSSFLLTFIALPCFLGTVQAGKYSSGSGRTYSSSSSRSSGSTSRSSSGSSSSFSSGSSSSKPASSSSYTQRPSPSPSVQQSKPSSASSNFSTPRSSYSSGSVPSTSSSFSRPAPLPNYGSNSIDSGAAKAKQKEQSTQNFVQSRPAATPVPSVPRTVNSSPPPPPPRSSYSSRGYATSSNFSNSGTSANRSSRHYPAFSSYYSRPVVVYHDSYSSPFWYWMLDQPRPVRAAWYYNHQSTMDPARQAALVAADPAITQEVTQVAATTPTPDPSYTPPGIEPQAMTAALEQESVEDPPAIPAAEQVSVPVPAAAYPMNLSYGSSQPAMTSRSSSWLSLFILLGGGAFVTWLVFFKRWKPARA